MGGRVQGRSIGRFSFFNAFCRSMDYRRFAPLKVKVLGSAGSYQSPTRQCSSYLAVTGETAILLDVGNGSFGNLLKMHDPFDIRCIFLSHRHHDHIADIVSLYHFLKFVPNDLGKRRKIPVFASKATHDFLANYVAVSIFDIFEKRVVSAGESQIIEGNSLSFGAVNHIDGSLSLTITDGSGERLVYSGDSAYSNELATSIAEGSTLLTESTYLEHKGGDGGLIHMDAHDVARLCNDAEVKGVIISHVAYPNDPEVVGMLVRDEFSGFVEVANDLDVYEIVSGKLCKVSHRIEEGY